MSTFHPSPASRLGRRAPDRASTRPHARPYPAVGSDAKDVALQATRALLLADDPHTVREIVATAVGDLGGALVPARFEPVDALGVDVSLGLGEPVVVVVEPLSLAAIGLQQVVPRLVEDARSALLRRRAPDGAAAAGAEQSATTGAALHVYLRALDRADGATAQALVTALLQDGNAPGSVVDDVLAPAQREVGERWYRREWTSADEHAATAITDRCLASLPCGTAGPAIVVAAPEGEWHALPTADGRPARARHDGERPSAPDCPARDLQRHLETTRPAALALSCTLSTNLLAAASSIAAAHAAGVPVVAGGRAFGRDGLRARALGADAWSSTARGLAALVPTLTLSGAAVDVPHEAVVADATPDDLLDVALERQAAGSSWVGQLNALQQRQARDDLRWLARHAAAAHACGDPSVLADLLTWLGPLPPRTGGARARPGRRRAVPR
jgi:hypothetical protein